MMNKPYIDELSEKGESRYTLIAVAAKRARQITEENPELSHEINDDKLKWHHHVKEAAPTEVLAAQVIADGAGTANENDEAVQSVNDTDRA